MDALLAGEKKNTGFSVSANLCTNSVYDYISFLSDVKKIPLFVFYLIWLGYAAAIASLFFNVTLGVCLIIFWMVVCAIFSFAQRRNVEKYL